MRDILVYVDTPLWSSRLSVLRCTGDEDASTKPLRRRALARAKRSPKDVVVDLSELGFADPSLMIDLAMVAQRLRMRGRGMRLRGAQPHIRRSGCTTSPACASTTARRRRAAEHLA